jgi:hypothetical protein
MSLDAVAAELSRSSTAALEASHELLAHYGDTGEARSQRALDTLVDHAADALRALADSFADLAGELQPGAEEPAVHGSARRGGGRRR